MAGLLDDLYANPMFHMGLGLMAQPGNIGRGGMLGMRSHQDYQQNQQAQQLMALRLQEEERKRKVAEEQRRAQMEAIGLLSQAPAELQGPPSMAGGSPQFPGMRMEEDAATRQQLETLGRAYPGFIPKMLEDRMFPKQAEAPSGMQYVGGKLVPIPGYAESLRQITEAKEGPKGPDFETAQKLRKEFLDVTQEFPKISDSYGRILASTDQPSAAGDLALIFNYMKMLDPGSVVRESEFATAQNAGSIPERIRAQYNNVMRGERLSEEQRKDFLDRSGRLYNKSLDAYEKRHSEYAGLAKRYQIDPNQALIDRSIHPRYNIPAPPASAAATPQGGPMRVGRFIVESE